MGLDLDRDRHRNVFLHQTSWDPYPEIADDTSDVGTHPCDETDEELRERCFRDLISSFRSISASMDRLPLEFIKMPTTPVGISVMALIGFLRLGIIGSLGAAAGASGAMGVLYVKYVRAMEDWERKREALQRVASMLLDLLRTSGRRLILRAMLDEAGINENDLVVMTMEREDELRSKSQ